MRSIQGNRYLTRSKSVLRTIHSTSISNSSTNESWKTFATIDPWQLSDVKKHEVLNLINGEWTNTKSKHSLPDPLTGKEFMKISDVKENEIDCFVKSLNSCSKSGLHNPLKDPQRYLLYGDISAKAAAKFRDPKVLNFFAKLIQRVAPKSEPQVCMYWLNMYGLVENVLCMY